MFDILGIDWGSVRFGMAFGSSETGLVLPCTYECFHKDIWGILKKESVDRKIKMIVLGMPMTRQLRDTEVSLQVKDFLSELRSKFPTLQIETINERNTTAKALVKILDKPIKNKETSKHGINHNSAVEIVNLWIDSVSEK
jgi:putative transcription antitermination factor YqgF